ncbi:MAG TPA: flavodoxin/nitric oxide synthase [Actinotalea sp.]|nr:flavodoxin/nitric oxide synthase [Actinotalea sp.]
MTSLVVYESMFGATKAVAEAIGEGLAAAGPVRVVEVGALAAAPDGDVVPTDVTLLVVGGPTHAFGMTRASTRADAAKELGPVISATIGVREWLERVTVPDGVGCAAFDTKVLRPNLPGSAGKGIDKHLRRLGGRPVTRPRTFTVHGKSDGLVEGQVDQARAWGAELGDALTTTG